MSVSLVTVSYLGATILFILSLGGLSNPETAKRGNWYGIVGMAIAVLATVFGSRLLASGEAPIVNGAGYAFIVGAMAVGGAVGLYAARIIKMTQMPELVAIMHSLVGFAACAIGFASYIDTSTVFPDRRRAHDPPARNLHRRADRRGDLHRFGDRLRQAVGPDQRQAGAVAGAQLDQPRRPADRDLLRLRVPQRRIDSRPACCR